MRTNEVRVLSELLGWYGKKYGRSALFKKRIQEYVNTQDERKKNPADSIEVFTSFAACEVFNRFRIMLEIREYEAIISNDMFKKLESDLKKMEDRGFSYDEKGCFECNYDHGEGEEK